MNQEGPPAKRLKASHSVNETLTIEVRRKRSEAIKANRGQETPTLAETLVLSSGCVSPTPGADSGFDRIPPSGTSCHLP